jgi:ArsR family transcriptional regulator, arsenate/arsenite/antimonite-responsive transcriptional repressor
VSQPTVSHHLKLLHDAGLLEREKRGAWVYYRVVPDRLEAIRAALVGRLPKSRAAKRA